MTISNPARLIDFDEFQQFLIQGNYNFYVEVESDNNIPYKKTFNIQNSNNGTEIIDFCKRNNDNSEIFIIANRYTSDVDFTEGFNSALYVATDISNMEVYAHRGDRTYRV